MLDSLPLDLALFSFEFLDPVDIWRVCHACSFLRRLSTSQSNEGDRFFSRICALNDILLRPSAVSASVCFYDSVRLRVGIRAVMNQLNQEEVRMHSRPLTQSLVGLSEKEIRVYVQRLQKCSERWYEWQQREWLGKMPISCPRVALPENLKECWRLAGRRRDDRVVSVSARYSNMIAESLITAEESLREAEDFSENPVDKFEVDAVPELVRGYVHDVS